MAKSTAEVIHTDGRRIRLDDYIYANMHLIVGRLASGFYPDHWTDEARIVEQGDGDDDEPPGPEMPVKRDQPTTAS